MAEFIVVTISLDGDEEEDGLILEPDTGYYIARDGIGPGAVSWRRDTVTSPYVGGDVLVHAVKDVQVIPVNLRVVGTTAEDLHTKIQTLTDAVSQFSYTVTAVIDNVEYEWTCQPADWSVGSSGAWMDMHLRSLTQPVTLSIPRQP